MSADPVSEATQVEIERMRRETMRIRAEIDLAQAKAAWADAHAGWAQSVWREMRTPALMMVGIFGGAIVFLLLACAFVKFLRWLPIR